VLRAIAQAAIAATSVVAPPAVALSLTATDGTYDVPAALTQAAAGAPCPIDPRDLAAIQLKESPSAIVGPDGRTSNPDGSPIRGDGGHSFGPFQFNEQAGTWAVYGHGSPDNYGDAAAATARMLCANNYATDRMAALARHNGSGPAARAYAADVDAAARAMPALPVGAPGGPQAPPDSPGDCAPTPGGSRYAIGAFLDRAWCAAVVRPWLALSSNGEHHEQWAAADRWLFGPDAAPSPGGPLPTGTKAAGGITCPVTVGLVMGDGWGQPRTGHTHQGLDIFGDMGSPAVAPFTGTVIDANSDEGAGGLGGRSVTIRATGGPLDGTEVYLAHLDRVDVEAGQGVTGGQQVGAVGNSGNARGGDSHIHAQWYPSGQGAPAPAGDTLGVACGTNPDVLP
jgi:murein DD-endopeptidase MepM/ murein hydrolase activator NlpD